ncbi:hypothetical protein BN996_03206 [Haloferax massiliensis]|uniref:Uncharacterized protein n=1 Tax=Haloferax massiliensis TaxID=1476858 RepID=A0A0D6JUZ9_9EURY|nr:hypothetical protein BN996_03206 [Haloferax massiliensis]
MQYVVRCEFRDRLLTVEGNEGANLAFCEHTVAY